MVSGKIKSASWQLWSVISIALLMTIIIAVNLINVGHAEAKKEIYVLYIGNSLTSTNDLPRMVADLAKSNHYKIVYDTYAPGGRRFSQHASDSTVLKKIQQRPWDFVVLQEQSQMPALSPAQVEKVVYWHAKRLSQQIKSAHKSTKVVFYQTMARKNGAPGNIRVSRELGTYWGMQRRINQSYLQMAQDNRAMVAPVGSVWEKARSQNESIHLYADPVHPNVNGTYLAACVFYATFFQDSPLGLSHPRQVDAQTAKTLQNIVYREMFFTSNRWDWSQ